MTRYFSAILILCIGCKVTPTPSEQIHESIPRPPHKYTKDDYTPLKSTEDCSIPALPSSAKGLPVLPSGLIVVPDGFGAYAGLSYGPLLRYNTIVTDRKLRGCK
jgi:hypothetical protein